LLLAVAPAAAAPPPAQAPPKAAVARPDPEVRRGVLPNGLRYAVMHNATPAGSASIRLGIEVGSYEEADDERGVAHFLEHMAFNGSRHFKTGEIDKLLALSGVGFGRDLNAFTGQFSTTYQLDLPVAGSRQLQLGLSWLRDVGDGLLLTQAEVDSERGVVEAERQSGISDLRLLQQQVEAFHLPGLRSVARDPIGVPQTLRAIDAGRLRAFYEKWYRPENAVLVIVGDLPVGEMESRIRQTFGDWAGHGPSPAHRPLDRLKSDRKLDVLVRAEPNLPSLFSACRVRAADARAPDDPDRRRDEIVGAIATSALQERLRQLQAGARPALLSAAFQAMDANRDASGACLDIEPIEGDWGRALPAALRELQRFLDQGPTEKEVERAIEDRRSSLRGAVAEAATRRSRALAREILEYAVRDRIFASPREAMREFDIAVDDLSPADVKAAFARQWSGAGPLLALNAPQPPAAAAVEALWRQGEAAKDVPAYADQAPIRWGYSQFGPRGQVVKREVISRPAFVRLTFQNGVLLNFKQTAFDRDLVQVHVRYGAGRREIENRQLAAAKLGAGLLGAGGLGKNSAEDLASLFRTTTWDARLSIGNEAFHLQGGTTTTGLGRELEILAAFATDPGFRREAGAALPTAVASTYRIARTIPEFVVAEALLRAIDPDSPDMLPPQEELASLTFADFERILKPSLTKDPLEVTIVGDVDEKTAVDLVAGTFGALPPRPPGDRARPDTRFLQFPASLAAPIRTVHEGSQDRALVALIWPLYVARPERRREEFALTLTASILETALRQRIREQLGKSYAPTAGSSMPDFADQGSLQAMIETSPADVDAMLAEAKAVAERLRTGAITAEQLEAARRPILSGMDRDAASNRWWAGMLDAADGRPDRLREVLGDREIMASITLAEVRKAAADWLTPSPIVVIGAPRPPQGNRP
jgi:zinc protease